MPRLQNEAIIVAYAKIWSSGDLEHSVVEGKTHHLVFLTSTGAGAILQVVVEVAANLHRLATWAGDSALCGTTLAGFAGGLFVMYATAIAVAL